MRPTKEVMIAKSVPCTVDEWLWDNKRMVKASELRVMPHRYSELVEHCKDLKQDLEFRLRDVEIYLDELNKVKEENPEYFL